MNAIYLGKAKPEYPTVIDHEYEEYEVNCISYSCYGVYIAFGCNDGHLRIAETVTRNIFFDLDCFKDPIITISWSTDGEKILVGTDSTENNIKLIFTTERSIIFEETIENLTELVFRPGYGGKYFVANTKNVSYYCQDIGGLNKTPLIVHDHDNPSSHWMNCKCSFSEDGRKLVIASNGGRVCLMDAETRGIIDVLQVPTRNTSSIKNVEYQQSNILIQPLEGNDLFFIKVFNDPKIKLEFVKNFNETLDNKPWEATTLSFGGHYIIGICGGILSAKKKDHNQHTLVIYSTSTNQAVEQYYSTEINQRTYALKWQPHSDLMTSIHEDGNVFEWMPYVADRYTQFVSQFTELKANLRYEELESDLDEESPFNQDLILERQRQKQIDIDSMPGGILNPSENFVLPLNPVPSARSNLIPIFIDYSSVNSHKRLKRHR
eukprot:TRINITY_DN269_c0_g1_i1.p1 TRINITY_DN269_c0_g1~~TRINITY_DN269_c0_g1_i1.p1  ORF type:complete len:450 (+),score=113.16 TRINITY_DN269_c0_g1_i1:50-1351(+)